MKRTTSDAIPKRHNPTASIVFPWLSGIIPTAAATAINAKMAQGTTMRKNSTSLPDTFLV